MAATDWTHPPPGFTYALFDRVSPARNENRFYRIGWQPTLFDAGAVVRIYGRKGGGAAGTDDAVWIVG